MASFFSLIILAVGYVLTVRYFSAREREWQQRERDLIDRLLKREHIAPLQVEQERVFKIADPEAVPPLSDGDLAMYEDDLLEDLQYLRNLGHGMTPADAKAMYPMEWAQIKRRYDEQHAPLRMN